jgi:chromosome segregation ATPase
MVADVKGARGDLARVEHVHGAILGFLHDLDAAREPAHILEILESLGRVLPAHFSEEEGANGLFEELQAARPANQSRLKSLAREHREILQAFEELERQSRQPEGRLDRIREDKTAFVRRVRSHEQTETRLFMDTYLLDEGGPG